MMKKTNVIVLLFVLGLQTGILPAQPKNDTVAKQFTLNQAVEYAIQNSYTTQSARIDVAKAEKKVKETVAIGLPQISGTADYQNMLDLPVQIMPGDFNFSNPGVPFPVTFGQQHNAGFGVTLNQLIFSGEYILGLKSSQIYKEISIKQNTKTEKETRELISQTYIAVLIADENIRILDSTITNQKKLLKNIQATHEQGLVDDITVEQMEFALKSMESTRFTIERRRHAALSMLKYQMGLNIFEPIELSSKLSEFTNLKDYNALLGGKANYKENIEYQIADLNVLVNENLLKYNKSTYLPQLAGFFTYSRDGVSNDFSDLFSNEWYPTTIVGLQLNVPIFSSGQRRAKVQQAELELDRAHVMRTQAEQGIQTQIYQKKGEMLSAMKTYQSEQQNLELARKIHQKTLAKYQQGVASDTDLTQAQNQYLNTQTTYFSAVQTMITKRLELEKLIR